MKALEWITKEAKKLRKEYPKRFATWREYVAQASAIYASKHKGKSPVGQKKIGASKSGYHKDTKSHNVNVRVVSGYEGTSRSGNKTQVHYTRHSTATKGRSKSVSGTPGTYVKLSGTNYPLQKEIVVGKIGDVAKLKNLDNFIPNVKVKISRGRKYYGNTVIKDVSDVVGAFRKYFVKSKVETQEFAAAMFVDTQLKIIGVYMHSQGGITATVVDKRLIIAAALQLGATGIILAHNHPSGNKQPSDADIRMTKELVKACSDMEIKLIDHIIITQNGFNSLRESGSVRF